MAARNYQSFKKLLFNQKVSKKELFEYLKSDYTFEEQENIIKQVPKIFSKFLYSGLLLSNEGDLEVEPKSFKRSYEKEINWFTHQFKYYSNQLQSFLEAKQKYEAAFLLGDYENSAKILTFIKEKISFSYWGIEQEFLQTQYSEGLEFNFKLHNSCKEKDVKSGAYFFLIHFFSYKVEEDISFFSYQNALTSSLRGFNKEYTEFFSYRLNPLEYNFSDLDSLLWVCSNLSLLDRYLVTRDVIVNNLLKSSGADLRQWEYKLANFLKEHLKDNALLKIGDVAEKAINESFLEKTRRSLFIIDLFSTGQYEQAILEARKNLRILPDDFSILEIYVKSHIYVQIDITPVHENKCLLNDIAYHLFNYLSKNSNTNESFVELLTLANAISSFDFAKELTAFLEVALIGDEALKKAYYYNKYHNPLHYNLHEKIDEQQEYLQRISSAVSSDTTAFFLGLVSDTPPSSHLKIPDYRYYYYKAKHLFQKKDFQGCSICLEQILNDIEGVGYQLEAVVFLLFSCYFKLNRIDCAINLYVNNYIKNEEIVLKIETKEIVKFIVDNRFRVVSHENINFPIFVYLSQAEIDSKFIAYDLFMRSNSANRPTELLTKDRIIDKNYIYFLKTVANPKIISRKAMVFRNSSEVLKERIAICQGLTKIDNANIEDYSKEISEHTQRITVQQRIKEIDQSMIYVDENGIISSELGEINKSFNRFKNISELLKLKKIDAKGISIEALAGLLIGEIDTFTYKKTVRKTDLHFELFVQLFLEIRDKFLFSNHYGLDYYLSQRIRHGTIIGQVRKQFQENRLVTSKSAGDGSYTPNKYWSENILELKGQEKDAFEQRMSDFSSRIDKIINDLKDKYIQIRTEDPKTKQTGWFDFMYIPPWDQHELYNLFISTLQYVSDFNEFIVLVFNLLWEITERNLFKIREKIDRTVKNQLIKELDELEVDLSEILKKNSNSRLSKSIADCRTNIQAELDTVIRWFNKSKNDEIDFTLEDAFNTSLKIVNNINSPSSIHFTEKIEAPMLLKGVYFPHFVDLLKIFITNIFNYYRDNNLLHRPGEIEFIVTDKLLTLRFSNDLSKNTNLEDLSKIVEDIKIGLSETSFKGIRGEGNTGFPKANNIIKNVFRNWKNEIDFNVTKEKFAVICSINLNALAV